MIRYCTEHMPKWNTISISGYHIREAGSTAAQELAFTLRDGIEYVQWCVDAGMDVDSLRAPAQLLLQLPQRLLRGDREVPGGPAHLGAHHEGALRGEEPALLDVPLPHPDRRGEPDRPAAVQQRRAHGAPGPGRPCSGGTQSLHTNSLDEALALPTEEAVTIALRTQQVIAHESGVVNTADPAGRLVLRREAHERHRGGGPRLLPQDRRHGRHGGGDRARASRSARSRRRPSSSRRRWSGRRRSSWASTST